MKKVLTLLAILSDEDVEWMVEVGNKRVSETGEPIIIADEPIDALHIVLDGRFEVCAGKTTRQIQTVGAGEILGAISLLDSRPPSTTTTALQSSSSLRIPLIELEQRLATRPGFAGRFYKAVAVTLAQRLREASPMAGENPNENSLAESHEIDPEIMNLLTLAGARFNLILDRLRDD